MKKPAKTGKTIKDRRGEDAALWEFVTRSVTPIAKKPKIAPASAKTPPKAAAKPSKNHEILIKAPPRVAKPAPPAAPQAPARGFDKSTATKMKKGRLEIEGHIDLHGMTQDEAHHALTRFIRNAARAHKRTLLVITGKGRLGGGILRRAVPMWLQEGDCGHLVLAVTTAAPKDGGDGALYVRLRKPSN